MSGRFLCALPFAAVAAVLAACSQKVDVEFRSSARNLGPPPSVEVVGPERLRTIYSSDRTARQKPYAVYRVASSSDWNAQIERRGLELMRYSVLDCDARWPESWSMSGEVYTRPGLRDETGKFLYDAYVPLEFAEFLKGLHGIYGKDPDWRRHIDPENSCVMFHSGDMLGNTLVTNKLRFEWPTSWRQGFRTWEGTVWDVYKK